MAGGRPTKYRKEYAEKLPDMFKNGESVAEVCAKLGIWKQAFYEWVEKHEEFSNAYKKGMELSEAWWTKLGRVGSAGKANIQPATWIFNMKNRFKWTDRNETTVDGDLQLFTITEKEKEAL